MCCLDVNVARAIFSVDVDHYGVEQAFMPAYWAINCRALAPEGHSPSLL